MTLYLSSDWLRVGSESRAGVKVGISDHITSLRQSNLRCEHSEQGNINIILMVSSNLFKNTFNTSIIYNYMM